MLLWSLPALAENVDSVIHSRLYTNKAYNNPFLDEAIWVDCQGPGGDVIEDIPGFYNGSYGPWHEFAFRWSPRVPGNWTCTTSNQRNSNTSPDSTFNPQLHNRTVTKLISPRSPTNLGALRINEEGNKHYFRWTSGRYEQLLGVEIDALFALDLDVQENYDPYLPKTRDLIAKLKLAGFNEIYTNLYAHDTTWAAGNSSPCDVWPAPVSLWPGGNDAQDKTRFDLHYLKHVDRVLTLLFKEKMIVHLMIGVWNKQVNWDPPGSTGDELLYRYITARYNAVPNLLLDVGKEVWRIGNGYVRNKLDLIHAYNAHSAPVTAHDWDFDQDHPHLDFRADQKHEWEGELAEHLSAPWPEERPIAGAEYGYEQGDLPFPTFGNGWEAKRLLRRHLSVYNSVGHTNWYYEYMAWDQLCINENPLGFELHSNVSLYAENIPFWVLDPARVELLGAPWSGAVARANPDKTIASIYNYAGNSMNIYLPNDGIERRAIFFMPTLGYIQQVPVQQQADGTFYFQPPIPGGVVGDDRQYQLYIFNPELHQSLMLEQMGY